MEFRPPGAPPRTDPGPSTGRRGGTPLQVPSSDVASPNAPTNPEDRARVAAEVNDEFYAAGRVGDPTEGGRFATPEDEDAYWDEVERRCADAYSRTRPRP